MHLIPPVPGLVEQFKPRFSYLLVDENAYTDSQLASLQNLVAAVFRIEHPASPEAIGDLIALLDEWLVGRPGLRRMFAVWIRATCWQQIELSGFVAHELSALTGAGKAVEGVARNRFPRPGRPRRTYAATFKFGGMTLPVSS